MSLGNGWSTNHRDAIQEMMVSRNIIFIFLCMYILSSVVIGGNITFDNFNIREFTASVSCKMSDRLAAGCAERQSDKSRSIVECAAKCEVDCVGIHIDANHDCYIHTDCPETTEFSTCDRSDQKFNLYVKDVPCKHKGIFNESSQTCKCVGGWVGFRCERPATSCQELSLFDYEIPLNIWVTIKTKSLDAPFRVHCSLRDGFFTSKLVQNTGLIQPNRTWQEFLEGFFINENNFWIGLEKMRALNIDNLKILCLDTQFGLAGYNLFSYRHNNFHINDANAGFKFTFGGSGHTGQGPEYIKYGANYKSCLEDLRNVKFSTWDTDNDHDDQRNCAFLTGSGWWYKNCSLRCAPMGFVNEWLSISDLNLTQANYAESIMYFTTA